MQTAETKLFFHDVGSIALPVTLQSLLQASFSVVDQCMTGQLGTVSVAGIGLGGKFAGIYAVMAAAVATGAGILIAQYAGKKEDAGVRRSFWMHLGLIGLLAAGFAIVGWCFAGPVMGLYSQDAATAVAAAQYLRMLAPGFLPLAVTDMLSTLLRCKGNAKAPLYASLASAVANTGLNYLLIFGRGDFPAMGVAGAALATTAARCLECGCLLCLVAGSLPKGSGTGLRAGRIDGVFARKTAAILMPILGCEFLWSLGENVYAVIYGRMGTQPCAAITLTNPIQSLMIGALTGLSAAAGILTGRRLGEGRCEVALRDARRFVWLGLVGAAVLSVGIVLFAPLYVQMFRVEETVRRMTVYILYAYAAVAPFKVGNMILEGGILRSGGKTGYAMAIDLVGTWGIGVPVGLAAGLWLRLPIWWVYGLLSLEECVRFAISCVVFTRGKWARDLTESA